MALYYVDAVQKSEAKILGMRWAIGWQPVLSWMQTKGFLTAMDLRVFSSNHSEAMDKGLADFWEWAT